MGWASQIEPHVNLGLEPGGREHGHGLDTVRLKAKGLVEAERRRVPFSHFKLNDTNIAAIFTERDCGLQQGSR